MKDKNHSIEEYKQISGDVWTIFKTYFPEDADISSFADEVHKLDLKYKSDPFMQKLLKVYFDELKELKG
jgi:hypothetical protein